MDEFLPRTQDTKDTKDLILWKTLREIMDEDLSFTDHIKTN